MVLNKLVEAGEVERNKEGKYRVVKAPTPREVVKSPPTLH